MFSEDGLDPKWVLIHAWNLPISSAFIASQRGGPEFLGWDQEAYAQADMVDALQDIAYILIMANRDPNKPPPPLPQRYRRPGVKEKVVRDDQRTDFKPGSFGHMLQTVKRNKRARLKREAELAAKGA